MKNGRVHNIWGHRASGHSWKQFVCISVLHEMKGKVKFIDRNYSTYNYRAFWSHVLLAGPKLQWGEPQSCVLGKAIGARLLWWSILHNQASSAPARLVGGVTWLRIPVGIAFALPSLKWFLLSLSVALQPSTMWLRFHRKVSQSQGRASLLCSYAFMVVGCRNRQLWPCPHKAIQDASTIQLTDPSGKKLSSSAHREAWVWIWLSCVTPFLSHNWTESLL